MMLSMSSAWTIKRSISLGFVFLLLCMGCMAAFSSYRMMHVLDVQKEQAAGLLPAARLANDFQREMLNARISLIYFVTVQKQGSRELGMEHLRIAHDKLKALDTLVKTREELTDLREPVSTLNGELANYIAELGRTINLVQAGTVAGDTYTAQVRAWAGSGALLVGTADKTQALSAKVSETHSEANIDSLDSTIIANVSAFGVSLLVCIVVAVVIVRKLNGTLRAVTAELESTSDQIALSSSQIARSSQSLAQNTSELAATIEETSAATIEISTVADKTKDKSAAAVQIAIKAQTGCDLTNASLTDMGLAMEAIHDSSKRVSKIVKVIDDIAFQTNILALNASVEAARAGEHGQGFAVVADEVRNLAMRCASAAKDTTLLVEESMQRSNGGRDKMKTVVAEVETLTLENKQINTLIEEIRTGSIEQSRGVDQINQAISQMEQVTQSSAAQAEQSAASASELSAEAAAMSGVVARLRVLVEGASTRNTPQQDRRQLQYVRALPRGGKALLG